MYSPADGAENEKLRSMDQEGAGADGNDGQDGNGAPSGGSPKGGSENDDKPITAKQLKAALESQKRHYEGKLESQRAEFEAFKAGAASSGAKQAAEPQKHYTRTELKAAVTAGQISQDQADDIWDNQVRAEAIETARVTATEVVRGGTQKERVDSQIESYKRLRPDIMDEGSETREKVRAEFNYLVRELGEPGTGPDALKTQLKAIRAVLGPLDKLESASRARRAPESEEQGGGSGRPAGGGKTGKKLVDKLDAAAKEHYERGIKQGRYKDWDAVEAELKYASPNVRQRLGIAA